MNKKLWAGFIIFIVVMVGAVVLLSRTTPSVSGKIENGIVINDYDVVRGNPNAKVALVEYSDLQCPACRAFYPVVEDLISQFGTSTKFVYKHFPLAQHGHAFDAAYSYEAARLQGKAPEMQKLMFENQEKWENSVDATSIFRTYASQIGISLAQYDIDVKSKAVRKIVADDYQQGVNLGINATPTFFINGKKVEGIQSFDDFKNLLKKEIDAVK